MANASTLARSNGTVTVTTQFNHGITTGQQVSVFNTSDSTFHGYYTATSTGLTTLTYSQVYTITAISRNNATSTVTVTVSGRHQFVLGQSVVIAGVTGGTTSFNGTFTLTNVNTGGIGTQFTYTQAGATESGTTTSATCYPANPAGSATDGTVIPVIRLTPTSVSYDDGFLPTGTASELTAITDNNDSTFIRAQDTAGRAIEFNLSNPPTSGTGSIQSNQDCGSVQVRLRTASTSASELGGQFNTASIYYGGAYVTEATSGIGTPAATPTDLPDMFNVVPDVSDPFTNTTLNGGFLGLYEYCTTTAARTSVYEAWVDCYLWCKPYLAGTAVGTVPTSPISTTTRPTFTWIHAQADGLPQAYYEVSVFTAATTNPTSTANRVWTSGTKTGVANSITCGVDLVPGITYYVYVRTGVQWTSWSPVYYGAWGSGTASSFTTFTITQQTPSAPAVSATWNSASQSVSLSVTGTGNMLSVNDSSFEATAGTWVNDSNATVSRTTAWSYLGTGALLVSAVAAGNVVARTASGTSGYVVTPGVTYKAFGMSRATTAARSVNLRIRWYDSAGTLISDSTPGTNVTNTTTWTPMLVSATAPANAAYAAVVYTIASAGGAGENHGLDMVSLTPNSSGTTTTTNLVLNPSAETGTTGYSSGQTGLASVGGVAYAGASSLRVTRSSTDTNLFALAATTGYATPTNAAHTVSAWFYVPAGSPLAGSTVTLGGEGGSGYTNGASSPATLVGGRWVQATRVITWTSTASLPSIVARSSVTTSGTGAEYYVYADAWSLTLGSTAPAYFDGDSGNARWSPTPHSTVSVLGQPWDVGGLTSRTVTVQRSDDFGATWTNVRSLTDADVAVSVQQASGIDYESSRNQVVWYRASASGSDGTDTFTSAGSPAAPTTVTATSDNRWWLKDPLFPALNDGGINVQAASVSNTLEEATGVFRVYGRSKAIVTAGAFTGEDGTLEVFATDAEWAALEPLLTAQRTLLLQDVNNDQKYVRITSRSYQKEWLGGDQTYRVSIGYVEVAAP